MRAALWLDRHEGKTHFKELGIDGWTILKLILKLGVEV